MFFFFKSFIPARCPFPCQSLGSVRSGVLVAINQDDAIGGSFSPGTPAPCCWTPLGHQHYAVCPLPVCLCIELCPIHSMGPYVASSRVFGPPAPSSAVPSLCPTGSPSPPHTSLHPPPRSISTPSLTSILSYIIQVWSASHHHCHQKSRRDVT